MVADLTDCHDDVKLEDLKRALLVADSRQFRAGQTYRICRRTNAAPKASILNHYKNNDKSLPNDMLAAINESQNDDTACMTKFNFDMHFKVFARNST